MGRPKQFIELAGLPMVGWSIATFAAMNEIAEIVVATEPESLEPMEALLRRLAPHVAHRVVRGGAARQDSVRAGLSALREECDAALVHDGARPLVEAPDVRSGMREVRPGRASLLATPVVDTIKVVERDGRRVRASLERAELWSAQTPQFATLADLRAARATVLPPPTTPRCWSGAASRSSSCAAPGRTSRSRCPKTSRAQKRF
jgi:2-C-methyl-D-erythritol 4-phosphate cytidylyltransferase